ncbi:hypothetical protein CMI44_01075 [Candidatus Pacearchaeota archaeon]|nr:hypothetical protein [Candidatus Pacearchaeota archaeon]
MNLQFYLEKLKVSEEYKKFMKENPSAYLCSGFFSIDKVGKDNKQHFDFCVPQSATISRPPNPDKTINKKSLVNSPNKSSSDSEGKSKIISFQLEENCKMIPIENFGEKKFEKISEEIDFDFSEVEKMIEEKMVEEKINNKLQKILLSLQKLDGKNFLVGTVFISGLGMIKVKVDLEKMEVIDFEKKSFFDVMKVVKKK